MAEDDRAVRESLARALGLEGYEVRAVSNGAQALEALRERPADVGCEAGLAADDEHRPKPLLEAANPLRRATSPMVSRS